MDRYKKVRNTFFSVSFLFLIAACSPQPEFELYEGRNISIAVLGTEPEVEEEQIDFQEITFEEFNKDDLRKYDAVFIMKENLSEAAESQYESVYYESNLPFFFIDSNKGAYPFTDSNIEHEDDTSQDFYASGFLATENDEIRYSNFGLYNDELSEENIQDVFSRIFKTVEESSGD